MHGLKEAVAVAEAAVEVSHRSFRTPYDRFHSEGVVPALCENGLGGVKHSGHRQNAAGLLRFTAHGHPQCVIEVRVLPPKPLVGMEAETVAGRAINPKT